MESEDYNRFSASHAGITNSDNIVEEGKYWILKIILIVQVIIINIIDIY